MFHRGSVSECAGWETCRFTYKDVCYTHDARRGGKRVDEVTGADIDAVRALVEKHRSDP